MKASPYPGILFPETSDEDIPCILIHDIIDGKPYCYKEYLDILVAKACNNRKTNRLHLQAVINNYLLGVLFKELSQDRDLMISVTPGLYINERNVLTCGITVFERNKLTIDHKYAQAPPKIALEVDVKVKLRDITEDQYVTLKINKLVNFGVEKVIWFFSKQQKVIIATNQSRFSSEWNKEVNILPGISCNVGNYLQSERLRLTE